jgi:3-oxoacyl-[acyl-carrier protein] reductase
MTNLLGRNCLITGASRGLGAHIATAFWKNGANLFLVARSASALSDLSDQLPPHDSQRIVTLTADLSDLSSPERIVAAAKESLGPLHVLVNNAALQGPIGPTWENDWAEWELTLRVNLLAPVLLCHLSIPCMARYGSGKIINLSGGGAAGPRPSFSAYAAAKAALVRFSETLAEETRDLGIDVNCVAPGAMNTAMLSAVLKAGPKASGQKEYKRALEVLHGGNASPERAAALCVFFASAASDGITGKLISAVWDPWEKLPDHIEDLRKTDIYTLRRIVPKDRGLNWGDK